MKKAVYVALVAMFVFAGMVSVASAAVGNDLQKASYLVWPKIVVGTDQDTVVTIFNDAATSTFLHCYWMDEFQNNDDFEVEITRFQTVWFKASDGSGMTGSKAVSVSPFFGAVGELKCWAVVGDEDSANFDLPVKKNALTGTGTIYNFAEGTAIGYNAYGFKKIAGGVAAGAELKLDGVDYDQCPQYLLGTFLLAGASFEDGDYTVEAGTTELTLAPCKQSLGEEAVPIYAKVAFTVYDEDEVGATGAYLCFKCWVETTLEDPPVISGSTKFAFDFRNFTTRVIGGQFATVKVEPKAATAAACPAPIVGPAVPVIGLIFGSEKITPTAGGTTLWAANGSIMHQTSTVSPIGGVSVTYERSSAPIDANKR